MSDLIEVVELWGGPRDGERRTVVLGVQGIFVTWPDEANQPWVPNGTPRRSGHYLRDPGHPHRLTWRGEI